MQVNLVSSLGSIWLIGAIVFWWSDHTAAQSLMWPVAAYHEVVKDKASP